MDWPRATLEQLCALLSDARPAVRDRVQNALVAQGKNAVAALAVVLSRADTSARQRAIWALARIEDPSALPPLREVLGANEAHLVATAARALAARNDRQAAPSLCGLLSAEAPPVRLAAAEALAHCGSTNSLPALWRALAAQPDRFLEHALIHAGHRLGRPEDFEAALQDENPRVQKAALLLLSQPPRARDRLKPAAVLARVAATDAELRQTALHILQQRPEWAEQALSLVRGWLQEAEISAEEQRGLQGLVLAFQEHPALQDLVAATLTGPPGKVSAQRRVLLLETMAQSSLPRLPARWIEAVAAGIEHPDPAVRALAVRIAVLWQVPQLDEPLARVAEDEAAAAELRVEALRGVLARRPKLSAQAVDLLLGQLKPQAGPLARLAAVELLGRSDLSDSQLRRLLDAVRGDVLISPALVLPAFRKPPMGSPSASPSAETAGLLLDYLAEAIDAGWMPAAPELQKALSALPEQVRDKAKRVEDLRQQSAQRQQAQLAEFEPLLKGGDPRRGQAVFFDKKAACSGCHRVANQGSSIGPDLTRIGAVRSGRDLLEAVAAPSASIAQGYENYTLATTDGRVTSGVIARQTGDVLVLREASGAELRLTKSEIDALKRQPTSLMPDGLAQALTRNEFRDLLAFLQSLR